MIQAHTWQRRAVGWALWHETLSLYQYRFGDWETDT